MWMYMCTTCVKARRTRIDATPSERDQDEVRSRDRQADEERPHHLYRTKGHPMGEGESAMSLNEADMIGQGKGEPMGILTLTCEAVMRR